MRKIFTFLSVLFIAVTVYIVYGTFQSAQKFEEGSIQNANRANALSQQMHKHYNKKHLQKSIQSLKRCSMREMQ